MSKVSFLPQGYQAPKSNSSYMKFQDGESKFRILSQPILGWEDWQDKKPIRFRFDEKPAKAVDPKKPIKHFWTMIVWNYAAEEIQVLQITQATIRKALEALCADEDWGAPYFYDLKVTRSGEGLESEYTLNPVPHKPLASHVRERFNEKPINLEALFYGDDPFSKEHNSFTPGIFDAQDLAHEAPAFPGKISEKQAMDLDFTVNECDEEYQKWFKMSWMKSNLYKSISDIPSDVFEKILEAATKRKDMHQAHIMKGPQSVDLMEA